MVRLVEPPISCVQVVLPAEDLGAPLTGTGSIGVNKPPDLSVSFFTASATRIVVLWIRRIQEPWKTPTGLKEDNRGSQYPCLLSSLALRQSAKRVPHKSDQVTEPPGPCCAPIQGHTTSTAVLGSMTSFALPPMDGQGALCADSTVWRPTECPPSCSARKHKPASKVSPPCFSIIAMHIDDEDRG